MRKLYVIMLGAMAVALTANAANHRELRTDLPTKKTNARIAQVVNQPEALNFYVGDIKKSKKVMKMRKADGNTNTLEGMWEFYLGDYYNGQNSVGEYLAYYDATLKSSNNRNQTFTFEDPTGYDLPLSIIYTPSSKQVAITASYVGLIGGYYCYQRPFVYDDNIGLDFQAISAQFDPESGIIEFDYDNGVAWAAYTNQASTGQQIPTGDPLGYFNIVDVLGGFKGEWTEMENGSITENIAYSIFVGKENTTPFKTKIYESVDYPGLIRIYNPFGGLYNTLWPGEDAESPMMVLDAEDPEDVLISMQQVGVSAQSTGSYYYFNGAWYYAVYGEQLPYEAIASTMLEDEDGNVTITIPTHATFVQTSGIYNETTGQYTGQEFGYGSAFPTTITFSRPKAVAALAITDVVCKYVEDETNGNYEQVTVTVEAENLAADDTVTLYYSLDKGESYTSVTENTDNVFTFDLKGLTEGQDYLMTLYAESGDTKSEDAEIMFVFQAGSDGVNGILMEGGNARYYNFQGVEVKNPQKGQLLIKVNGNKAEKVTF